MLPDPLLLILLQLLTVRAASGISERRCSAVTRAAKG
jgi:hypothetical protein